MNQLGTKCHNKTIERKVENPGTSRDRKQYNIMYKKINAQYRQLTNI